MNAAAALALLLAATAAPAAGQTVVLYAHQDGPLAHQLAGVAAALDPLGVTIAPASIPPGELWRPFIAGRIYAARVVLVVWSTSAAASVEVSAEWRMALASRARVVPVLLDDTTLPAGLSDRHGVDWRRATSAAPR